MNHENHDVELTAYALGELAPAEAAAVEARLADDPAARAEVERVRRTARRLEDALAAEATERPAVAGRIGGPRRVTAAPYFAAAAAVATGLTIGLLNIDGDGADRRPEVALVEAEDEPAAAPPPATRPATNPAPADETSALGTFAAQRESQRSLIAFQINEAAEQAREAAARGDVYEAHSALQRARTTRGVNAGIFNSEELSRFDRSIRETDRSLAERSVSSVELRTDAVARETRRPVVALGASPEPVADGMMVPESWRYAPADDREDYAPLGENDFVSPAESPLSTFSVDVDTASYANVRRFLNDDRLPPRDAVRIEELVNYFRYEYPTPNLLDDVPFAADVVVADAPWAAGHKLVRIGLQAADVEERSPANLVFLIDVSGSMQSPDKLPLVKHGLRRMAERLNGRDTVSIVVYAGESGVALEPTPGDDSAAIAAAVDALAAGGSTNGAAGIRDAYRLARDNFKPDGVNRVILATDGDFNVGTTDAGSLVDLVEEQAKSGVYLSVLGFGTGNLNDAMMEQVSNRGDGFYAYVDGEPEAERVLGERMLSTVQAVAKDVKVQVEFNPAAVSSYRLIGYANRVMPDQDFADDTKDAGDVGAGHQVTALYEIVPAGGGGGVAGGELKYQRPTTLRDDADPSELMTVKLRWKAPDAPKEQGTGREAEFAVRDADVPFAEAEADLRFAAAVAGFGMLLRDGEHRGGLTWPTLLDLVEPLRPAEGETVEATPEWHRRHVEFPELVGRAAALAGQSARPADGG